MTPAAGLEASHLCPLQVSTVHHSAQSAAGLPRCAQIGQAQLREDLAAKQVDELCLVQQPAACTGVHQRV